MAIPEQADDNDEAVWDLGWLVETTLIGGSYEVVLRL